MGGVGEVMGCWRGWRFFLTQIKRDFLRFRGLGFGVWDLNPPAPYRMPAEWEPHRATWICWPHHEPDWPGKLGPIPWVYAEIARVLAYLQTPGSIPKLVAELEKTANDSKQQMHMADMLSRNADEGDVVTGSKGINDGA